VSGSLTGDGIQILLDAVASGVVVLDLSEVDRVDDSAVRVLAGLWPERCKLQNCPRWLELWLARVRRCDADDD
jgi:ABC-type transporter Mla MlaB component